MAKAVTQIDLAWADQTRGGREFEALSGCDGAEGVEGICVAVPICERLAR